MKASVKLVYHPSTNTSEVVEIVNSLAHLPGAQLDPATVTKLVKNKAIDVTLVKDRNA